jgi:hypothetical protein
VRVLFCWLYCTLSTDILWINSNVKIPWPDCTLQIPSNRAVARLCKTVCVYQRTHAQMRLKYELDRIGVCAVPFSLDISNQFCHYWLIVQTGRTCDIRQVIYRCNLKILSRAVTLQAHGRSYWSGRRCPGERQPGERRSTCALLPLYSNGNRVYWLPAILHCYLLWTKVNRVCCLLAYFTL